MIGRRILTYLLLGALVLVGGGYLAGSFASAGEGAVSKLSKETHFHGVAVDPSDPDRVYLATHHGLFLVGSDGTARRVSKPMHDFMGFTPHPHEPNLLYASGHPEGGGNLGFIVSKDGGITWQTVGDGAHGQSDFHQMAVGRVDPSIVFGIYGTDLQVSRDGGRTWEVVSQIPDRIFALASSSRDADVLYAGSAGGLLRSADGGRTWSQAMNSSKPVTMVHSTNEGQVIAFVVGEGLIQAVEPDLVWEPLSNAFGNAVVLHFALSGSGDVRSAYAVAFDPETRSQALHASQDGGRTWQPMGGN